MGWTVGLEPSAVGHSGCVPGLPGTQGWDGQWGWSTLQWDTQDMSGMSLGWDGHWDWSHPEWDARDMSGISLGFPGLWDGMDSGIRALHTPDMSRMSPGFLRLWNGMDSGLEPSTVGRSGHVQMSLAFLGLWDRMDSGVRALHSWMLGTYPGCPWASPDSGMGWTVGDWDTPDISGMSLGFPGLWDGMDSGIGATRV